MKQLRTIALCFLVAAASALTDAKALRASQPEFVKPALSFARDCRFVPDSKGAFETTIAIRFSLKDE